MAILKIVLVLVLLIVSFIGGLFYERHASGEVGKLNEQLKAVQQQADNDKTQYEQIKETLQLVKRQIQADRVAYQALQESVESSEQERALLKQKVETQQRLLKQLREKLE